MWNLTGAMTLRKACPARRCAGPYPNELRAVRSFGHPASNHGHRHLAAKAPYELSDLMAAGGFHDEVSILYQGGTLLEGGRPRRPEIYAEAERVRRGGAIGIRTTTSNCDGVFLRLSRVLNA
jgi:hypothetical protein